MRNFIAVPEIHNGKVVWFEIQAHIPMSFLIDSIYSYFVSLELLEILAMEI